MFYLEVKHVTDEVKIMVEAVPPEEFAVVGWHKSVLLEDCDFVEHRSRMTVTRLREMGLVGNEEDVTSLGGAGFDEDDSSEEELARDEEIDEQRVFRENNPLQKEMWRVVVKDIVARVDEDGDGIAERRRFIRIGNTIRYDEPIDYCPYGVFAPIIMPHRFIGKSEFDLMGHWQRIQSTLLFFGTAHALLMIAFGLVMFIGFYGGIYIGLPIALLLFLLFSPSVVRRSPRRGARHPTL